MKNVVSATGKLLVSGCLALVALTAFCHFYYNVPVHYDNTDGSTDYKWEPNAFYSRGTEGFAWGKTNNEGFVNPFDYEANMPINVLIMGSSHMEGYQIAMDESTAGRLNQQFGEKTVYNLGISGHSFTTCCCNFKAALEKYNPSFIVLETGISHFSDEALLKAINGETAKIPSHAGGIISKLQKNQYLRLLYAQLKNYEKKQASETEDSAPAATKNQNAEKNNTILLSALLQQLSTIANDRSATIIVMYHPEIAINTDGSLHLGGNKIFTAQFAKLCQSNGIYFLDMSDRFRREYEESYTLPYGFTNTSVGSGHLNRYGHAMIADELYKLISEVA